MKTRLVALVLLVVVLAARGNGSGRTSDFRADGPVELCLNVSGQSPDGRVGPRASPWVYRAGTDRGSVASFANKEVDGCAPLALPNGDFYIAVNATPWTRWQATVRAVS